MRRCELAPPGPLTAWEGWHWAPLPLGVKLFLLLQKDNLVTPGTEQQGTHQAQSSGGLPVGPGAGKMQREMQLALTCLLCLAEPSPRPVHLTVWGIRRRRGRRQGCLLLLFRILGTGETGSLGLARGLRPF